jgi:hypothetical protein
MPASEICYFYKGRWVPRSHFYDGGEEMLYMGPPRPRGSRRPVDLLGLAIGCPLYAFIFYEMFFR